MEVPSIHLTLDNSSLPPIVSVGLIDLTRACENESKYLAKISSERHVHILTKGKEELRQDLIVPSEVDIMILKKSY